MTDDRHGEGAPRGNGRWDPLPQGEYDDGATAFVELPEGGIDALLASSDSPLAAPGQGYVPPRITAAPGTTDPAAAGWPAAGTPGEGAGWPGTDAAAPQDSGDRFTYDPAATQQWNLPDAQSRPPGQDVSGQDVTGQWSIPLAGGDLPDESGEFTTSSLVEQWGGGAPATLPGGAAAPWAPQQPEQPWEQPAAAPGAPIADGPHDARAERPGAHGPGHDQPPGAHAAEEAAENAAQAAQAAREAGEAAAAAEDARDATEAAQGPAEPSADPAEGDADGARAEESGETPPPPGEEHPLASYVLRVNGADRPVSDAWIGESLLYVLRERLGLAGAKDGCSQGECGACNVQVDGRLVASCLVPAVTAAGSEVRTVEGLAADGHPSDVQRALARCGAVQCGFCVPGMAMTVHDLLEGNPAPSELETRQALCGNLCRCSGYRGVVRAVQEVVAERAAHAAEAPEGDEGEPRIPHQAGPGAGGVHASAFEAPGAMGPHDPYGQDGGQA
ncbi:2Fe-2S iron-sulfur cluster-binding protein [Streptomyces sp. NPDC101117]|uniref:2Fe-2S iron-sulfur cluster-binding protein n=1 Tax=Streptomyces sp. NPDC101117 TaxID=3366108 RepID=UPI00382C0379